MFGRFVIAEKEQRSAVQCGRWEIGGVRFLEAAVRPSRSRLLWQRHLQRAAKEMARSGVRVALFPVGFSELLPFEKQGIRAADDSFLRAMTAAKILRRSMEKEGLRPSACRVALLADGMSAPVQRALMEIALYVRYTMLSAGGGGGELCSLLRREYGVSVLRNAGEEQLRRADVVLTFGGARPCGRAGCLWLPFGTQREDAEYRNGAARVTYSVPLGMEAALSLDCDRNALLSLLLEGGALRADELEVTEVMEIVQNA